MKIDKKKISDSFSKSAESYDRHAVLQRTMGEKLIDRLNGDFQKILDIGSGTGLLSQLLLEHGNTVLAIEPNDEMRAAAERRLNRHPGFRSLRATAEDTTLPDDSVDCVCAGQALHWFDLPRARAEFARILKPGGFCFFVWNWRNPSRSALIRDLEDLLHRFSPEYADLKMPDEIESDVAAFFDPGGFRRCCLTIAQDLDFAGLRGRVLSCSFMPLPGEPDYAPLLPELRDLFDRHQQAGRVRLEYETLLYYGRLI